MIQQTFVCRTWPRLFMLDEYSHTLNPRSNVCRLHTHLEGKDAFPFDSARQIVARRFVRGRFLPIILKFKTLARFRLGRRSRGPTAAAERDVAIFTRRHAYEPRQRLLSGGGSHLRDGARAHVERRWVPAGNMGPAARACLASAAGQKDSYWLESTCARSACPGTVLPLSHVRILTGNLPHLISSPAFGSSPLLPNPVKERFGAG